MTHPRHPHDLPPGRPASGASALAAAALALIGAAIHLLGAIALLRRIGTVAGEPIAMAGLAANVVLVALLLPGGVLLVRRRPAGRLLVALGSGFAVAYFATMVTWALGSGAADHEFGTGTGALIGAGGAAVLVLCVPAAVTLTLALVPATGRWVRRRREG
ncbi:hypothetical protein [Prauserella muralis]|uniref:Uncharacterized protein n=1 Tax=Prauserella muralis TaxID=588067 RepID=A0A2V4ALX6_9PSEU|nr:hypothetical protein [Prauserella muralis]PXY21222.1 hypothetical protein BAY60_27600 [Prauserella muralis]TWE30332.1 hypothetical protein FHX69_3029 [Prauserella muralis]